MKYFINITSWALLNSFATESISPYSFRTNEGRNINSDNERTDYLILSKKDKGGDFSIIVDESILDPECILPIEKSRTLFFYGKTIFYKKGDVSFRFSSEKLRDSLIAESRMMFEVKCVEKYSSDFYVKVVKKSSKQVKFGNPISFKRNEYIKQDNYFNRVKGAIVAYTRGIASTLDEDLQSLVYKLRELGNSFTGMHTAVMMEGVSIEDSDKYILEVNECKELYAKKITKETNLFDILIQYFHEIVRQASEREKKLKFSVSFEGNQLKKELNNKKDNLGELKTELNEIRDEEKKRGKAVGKKCVYFKKGEKEYERKNWLKNKIKEIKSDIVQMEGKINPYIYDSSIGSMFLRISDIVYDIRRKVDANIENSFHGKVNFGLLNIKEFPYIDLDIPDCSQAEREYFNITLREILNTEGKNLSDAYVLDLVEASAKKFEKQETCNTEEGRKIIKALRSFWKYRKNVAMTFDVPNDMPVFGSMMAFFVKPDGFDQIERYMQIMHIGNKQYGFMLWGAAMGYAAFPKTFTRILYNKEESYQEMDDFLFSLHKKIEQL